MSASAIATTDKIKPWRGWNKFSQMPVNVYTVSGDRITMMNKPNFQVLAKQLKAHFE